MNVGTVETSLILSRKHFGNNIDSVRQYSIGIIIFEQILRIAEAHESYLEEPLGMALVFVTSIV